MTWNGFRKTLTRTRLNLHPWLWVRVSSGMGAGCPKNPRVACDNPYWLVQWFCL